MKLLIGLGNPGQKYAHHRHNVGFMVADEIVRRHNLAGPRSRFRSESYEGPIAGSKTLLLKPMTFMNESGRAVGEAVNFFKLDPSDVVVFHDELDLVPGKLRVKLGGGVAGHNGLKSLSRFIGPDFVRVRVGIGHPGRKEQVHSHVLSDFSRDDQDWLGPTVEALAEHVADVISGDMPGYSNKVHLTLHPREDQDSDKDKNKNAGRKPGKEESA